MKVKKDSKSIFLKLSDFKRYNFVEEHQKVIQEKGMVWVLKMGKNINLRVLKDMKDTNGGIIFRSSRKNGHKFYYCHVVYDRKLEGNIIIPSYYNELLEYQGYTLDMAKESGDWFLIDEIREIPDEKVSAFKSVSSGNDLTISSKARSSYVFVNCDENIVF